MALDFTCNSPAIKRGNSPPRRAHKDLFRNRCCKKLQRKYYKELARSKRSHTKKQKEETPHRPPQKTRKKEKKVTCCQFTRNIRFYMYRPSDPTKGHQSSHTRTRLSFKLVVCAVRHSQLTVPLTVIKIGFFFFSIPRPKWEDRVKMLIGKQNIPPSVDSTDKSALSGGINCTERFSKIHMLYASLNNIFLYQLEENSM